MVVSFVVVGKSGYFVLSFTMRSGGVGRCGLVEIIGFVVWHGRCSIAR